MASPAPVLDFDDVTYRRGERVILPGLTFSVGRGEHWVVFGPNGAGKSTILSLAGGLAHPTSGTVHVLGERIGRVELRALRERIGHVNPRHPLESPLTIVDVVLTGLTGSIETAMRWEPSSEQRGAALDLIALFGLSGKAQSRWTTLSQGERGRALIARALITNPQLILLDEPTTGLDVAGREQLLETVERLTAARPELTTVLVTHHLEELPASTSHALLLSEGRALASGDVHDVLTTENVSAAFEHPIQVGFDEGRWSARTRRVAVP